MMPSEVVVEEGSRDEEGVVFMGVALRSLCVGRSGGGYLSRAILHCRGAPTVDTAFMGLTSCRWITDAVMDTPTAVPDHRHARCHVAVKRVPDRFTVICEEPVFDR